MNRFHVMPCVEQSQINGEATEGVVLPLASEVQNDCVLFFPVTGEIAELINHLMDISEDSKPSHVHMVEVFQTMLNTWRDGERYLSGIFIDIVYDDDVEEEILSVNLMLSSTHNGMIEAVVKVNFVHAIIVAILEDTDIMVSNALLSKLLPDPFEGLEDEDGEEFENPLADKNIFPVDEDILKIAKRIMDGDVK